MRADLFCCCCSMGDHEEEEHVERVQVGAHKEPVRDTRGEGARVRSRPAQVPRDAARAPQPTQPQPQPQQHRPTATTAGTWALHSGQECSAHGSWPAARRGSPGSARAGQRAWQGGDACRRHGIASSLDGADGILVEERGRHAPGKQVGGACSATAPLQVFAPLRHTAHRTAAQSAVGWAKRVSQGTVTCHQASRSIALTINSRGRRAIYRELKVKRRLDLPALHDTDPQHTRERIHTRL